MQEDTAAPPVTGADELRTALRWTLALALGIALGVFIYWGFVGPATQGFHIGYNWASDHQCLSRILQWCR